MEKGFQHAPSLQFSDSETVWGDTTGSIWKPQNGLCYHDPCSTMMFMYLFTSLINLLSPHWEPNRGYITSLHFINDDVDDFINCNVTG